MSYRPNDPTIKNRSPQHGIHIAGYSGTPNLRTSCSSSTPSASSSSSCGVVSPNITVTVKCAQPGCANTVTVVPHGYHSDKVHIHVECKKCYIPLVVEVKEKKTDKTPVMWDDEEWGGVQLVEEHEEGQW